MKRPPQPQGKTNGRSEEVAALLTAARAVLENRAFADAASAILVACKTILGADAGLVAVCAVDGETPRGRMRRSRRLRARPPLPGCRLRFAGCAHAPPRSAGSPSPTTWQERGEAPPGEVQSPLTRLCLGSGERARRTAHHRRRGRGAGRPGRQARGISLRPTPSSSRSLPRWLPWRCSRAALSTASRRTGLPSRRRCARAPRICARPRSSSRRWSRTCPTRRALRPEAPAPLRQPRGQSATGRPAQNFVGKTNREPGMSSELTEVWDAALRRVFATRTAGEARIRIPGPGWDAALRLPAGSGGRAGRRHIVGADRRPGRHRQLAGVRGRAARPDGRRRAPRGDRGAHPQPRPRDRAGDPARPPATHGPFRPRPASCCSRRLRESRSGPFSTATAWFPSAPEERPEFDPTDHPIVQAS